MKIFKQGLLHAVGALAYIVAIGTLMSNAERWFGKVPEAFAPVIVLSMLVVSAAVMGMLVFGRPVMLYIDGKKREAVALIAYTVGSLAAFTALLIAVLVARYR